jgi:hypothetical protein
MRRFPIPSPFLSAWPLKTVVLLLTLCLALAACGRKGPVRPLLKPLPAAPEKFTIAQKGDLFLLGWGIPKKNEDGSPLTDLQGFRVYRLKYDPARDCPECLETAELWRQVDLDYLQEARRIGYRLYLPDADLQGGSGYRYRVVPFTRSGFEGMPATDQRVYLIPPPAPQGLATTALDHLVRLHWEAVDEKRPGVALQGYNVYRHTPDQAFYAPAPVNLIVLKEPNFEDFGVENGKTYSYAVRAVVLSGGLTVESDLSPEAEAKPEAGK